MFRLRFSLLNLKENVFEKIAGFTTDNFLIFFKTVENPSHLSSCIIVCVILKDSCNHSLKNNALAEQMSHLLNLFPPKSRTSFKSTLYLHVYANHKRYTESIEHN